MGFYRKLPISLQIVHILQSLCSFKYVRRKNLFGAYAKAMVRWVDDENQRGKSKVSNSRVNGIFKEKFLTSPT